MENKKMNMKIGIMIIVLMSFNIISAQGLYYAVELYYDKGNINIKNVDIEFSNKELTNIVNERYLKTFNIAIVDNDKIINRIDFGVLNVMFYDVINESSENGEFIDGGMIGGFAQKGTYKIDCRFNKRELIQRIQTIASHKKNIHLYNLDALDLIKKIGEELSGRATIFYFDHPYYLKGESLYLNFYDHSDHEDVSKAIRNIKNSRWVVSYDAANEIKDLYKGYKKIEYSLLHTAHTARMGEEVLFFSKNMSVPRISDPTRA